MKLMSSNMIPAQTIADVATNKREFDTRISDWFTRTGKWVLIRILPVFQQLKAVQVDN